MDDLDTTIGTAEQAALISQQGVADLNAGDRSYIAKLIIQAFVLMVFLAINAVVIGSSYFEWVRIIEPSRYISEILGSVMLPVVTLVIGYYFGSK